MPPPLHVDRAGTPVQVPWRDEYARLAHRFADRIAVSSGDQQLTYVDLFARAFGLAGRLAALGVQSGQPVVHCLPNGTAAVWASQGIVMTGAAEVALDPKLGADDVDWCLGLVAAGIVVTDAARRDDFVRRGLTVLCVEDIAPATPVPGDPVPGAAIGKIGFTSGTTGRPKAILHSHGGRWLANQMLRANLPRRPGAGDAVLLMTPFTHGAGLQTHAWLDHGAAVELRDGVDVDAVRGLLDAGAVNEIFAPPTVLAKLCDGLAGRRYPHVKTIFCGTATLQPGLYARARAIFGPVVRITYGKSEITNPITVLAPDETDAWYADADMSDGVCLGWPAAGVEVRVGDDDEIMLRGPHMLAGWIDRGVFHPQPADAWHATGDVGRLDAEGRLFLLGRANDAIKSGGYKLYPEEIERAFAGEVAVLGIPSDYWGEVVVAVAAGAWDGSAEAESLTKYKRPRAYLSVDALPRNRQGKLSRAAVREAVLATYQLVDGPYPKFERR